MVGDPSKREQTNQHAPLHHEAYYVLGSMLATSIHIQQEALLKLLLKVKTLKRVCVCACGYVLLVIGKSPWLDVRMNLYLHPFVCGYI